MDGELKEFPEHDWNRALAIVAHPDDMEYGAAGAVARWTGMGKEVVYLMVTRGEAGIDGVDPETAAPLREREQVASAAVVGVDKVEFLDHRDGVIEPGLALRRDLAAAARRHRPELLITLNHRDSWGGGYRNSPDHRAVGEAVLDVAGDAGNRWIFPELEMEPWPGIRRVAVAGSTRPTHAADVSQTLPAAIASLAEHRAYLEGLGEGGMNDPEEFLTAMAMQTAQRFGGRKAVAFELFEF